MSDDPSTKLVPAPEGAEVGKEPVELGPSRWLVSASVAVIGLTILFYLFQYNRSGASVWRSGSMMMFRTWDEYLLVNVTWLLLPPLVVILGFLKGKPEEFGLRPPEQGAWKLAAMFYAIMLPVLFVMSRQQDFYTQYPLYPEAGRSYSALAVHQLTYGFYLLCWEFFFRGFLSFGLSRAIGATPAIIFQAIAFGIMHFGKPNAEYYSSFGGGLILGWMALRYRSFFPGFILHWAISATMDVLAIHAKPNGLF